MTVGLAAKPYICIGKVLGSLALPIKIVRDFPRFLQVNTGIVPRSGHNRFHPNSYQLIIHESPTFRLYVYMYVCMYS
jgi:hypothetical protein